MKLKVALVLLGIIGWMVAPGVSTSEASIIRSFTLHDHPGGTENPPPYGLRLDGLYGIDGVVTFSFDSSSMADNNYVWQQMRMDVYADGTVRIHGSMYGGQVDENTRQYVDNFGTFEIDYTYQGAHTTLGSGDLITAVQNAANGGSIVAQDDVTGFGIGQSNNNPTFSFSDKANSSGTSFIFDSDGHRLPNDNSSFVGRGWHMFAQGSGDNNVGGARDFLFTANQIPEPGSLLVWSLLGLGLVGGSRRRKS